MTKLEWCKANAPEALRRESDDYILEMMSNAYNAYVHTPNHTDIIELQKYDDKMRQLDTIVLAVLRLFGTGVAFKGGYMLNKMIPEMSRQTHDVDFSIQNSELYSDLIKTMQHVGDKFVSDGLISSYTIKPKVQQRMSGGMTMYNSQGDIVLGIDIGWHDLLFGTTDIKLHGLDAKVFTVERMLSDKLNASLSRKRFRRVKDFYDIYIISRNFDFDIEEVYNCFIKREPDPTPLTQLYPFNETILCELGHAYSKLEVRNYQGKNLDKPPFTDVMLVYDKIVLAFKKGTGDWSHEQQRFI